MTANRTILHLDMDAFFAAIEQRDHPELRGKPILVGHDGPRAVVTTASYEARPYGCHSAQPMAVAKRRCPHAIIVPTHGQRYRQASDQIFAILRQYTPAIQPLSIDEAFADLTGTRQLLGEPADVARRIKQQVREETGLTASIGIAPNMFLAKLASDLEKPDGLVVITSEMIDTWLPTLAVSRIWGVGPSAQRRLEQLGVRTIDDVRRMPPGQLQRVFGKFGEHIRKLALGIDDRRVTPDSEARSIGQERTFAVDVAQPDEVRRVLHGQVEQVARRLRRAGLLARAVTVKIRYGEFETITRSATLDQATDLTDDLWHAVADLFDRWARQQFRPVRLIGATARQLGQTRQMSLFDDEDKKRHRRIDTTTDRIVDKYGKGAIRRGDTL